MLYEHVDPMFVTQICHNTNAISTSHVIAKYMPETNMLTKLGIYFMYGKYMRCIYGTYKVTGINCPTRSILQICEIYGQMGQTFLHNYVKTPPTATST